jgi:hypothetical protein
MFHAPGKVPLLTLHFIDVSLICYLLHVINTSLVLFMVTHEVRIQLWIQRDRAVHSSENNYLAIVITGNYALTPRRLSPVCFTEKFLHYSQR